MAAPDYASVELGWRTLAWVLGIVSTPVRARILARLRDAIEHAAPDLARARRETPRTSLGTHGRLDPAARRDALVAGIAEVLRPCADALAHAASAA